MLRENISLFSDYSAYTATSDAHATAHGPNTPQTDLLGHRTIRETTKRPDAPQLQRQRQSDVVGTARSDRTEKYASHAARSRPEDSNARGWVCPGPLGGLTGAALARVRISVFESCSHRHRRAAHAAHATRTLRTAAHNAGRADAAAADAPESAPVSRVSTWHEASVVRCRPWRGWGSGTPCHDEEAVAAVVEELPRHLRHSGVRSRASLHSWRANRCSWPISYQCDAGTGRAAARRTAQSRRSFPVQQRTKFPVQQRTICEDRAALAAGGLCGTCRAAMA